MLLRSDRSAALGLAGVVSLACLTGCGGSSSGPKTLPPISSPPTTASPTSSPSITSTTQTKAQELAAATAVVRRYYKLLNGLSEEQHAAQAFSGIESRSCNCRGFVRSLRTLAKRREHYFGQAKLTTVRANVDSRTVAEVLVAYDATAGGIKNHNGAVISSTPAIKAAALNYRLEYNAGRWLIYAIDLVSKGHR